MDAWGGCLLSEAYLENVLDGPKDLHTERWEWDPLFPLVQDDLIPVPHP